MKFLSTTLALLLTLTLVPLVATGETRDIRQSALDTADVLGDVSMSLDHSVALGYVPGAIVVTKFGYNPEMTSPTVEESLWDVPELGGPLRCNTVVTTTPTVLYLSSDDEADAGEIVRIQGTTTDNVAQQLDVALGADNTETGTVFVAAGTWLRVNRMYALGGDLAGDVYLHIDDTDGATVDGIPDTPLTDIVAAITAGENQTLQACYRVPADFVLVLQQQCFGNATIGGTNDANFRLRGKVGTTASRTLVLYTVGGGDQMCISTIPPRVFPAGVDLEITGAATTQAGSATFGFLLLPKDYAK
jgi:hypothetical protein